MKKLLFILFFPITIPLYLIYRFFGWFVDTFIPFLQYDAIPFFQDNVVPLFTDKLFPAIKRLIKSIKEKSAERKEAQEDAIYGFNDEKNIIKNKGLENSNKSNTATHELKSISDYNILSSSIDYSLYPLAESDDPLFIRALAVASYKEIFTAHTLQDELNISYDRAMIIINQLLDSKLVSTFKDDQYLSNISFGFFNTMLEKFFKDEI